MARGSTRRPAPVGPPTLAATNPSAGIARLRNRLAELAALDPAKPTDPAFEALEDAIHSNVREIFGENSHEDDAHWSLKIEHSDQPFYLSDGYDEDDYPGSYGHDRANARRVKVRTEGIARTKVILESLIKRLEERAADAAPPQHGGVGAMSAWNAIAKDRVDLVKPDGRTVAAGVRAVVNPTNMLIAQSAFPVEVGDTIVRDMTTAGLQPERYEVEEADYQAGPGNTSHWQLSVRKIGSRPVSVRTAAPPPQASTHITNNSFTINGPAGAVGPGARAIDNAIIQHNNEQALNVTDPRLADDLSKIKKALVAIAAENDDDHEAIEEAHKIGQAQKAIKDASPTGVMAALKTLRAKTWAVAQGLFLAYLDAKGREHLGLPPGKL